MKKTFVMYNLTCLLDSAPQGLKRFNNILKDYCSAYEFDFFVNENQVIEYVSKDKSKDKEYIIDPYSVTNILRIDNQQEDEDIIFNNGLIDIIDEILSLPEYAEFEMEVIFSRIEQVEKYIDIIYLQELKKLLAIKGC